MKQREPDSEKHHSHSDPRLWIIAGCIMLGIASTLSCKRDIQYIQMLADEQDVPVLTLYDFSGSFTDSGQLKVVFRAPVVKRYNNNPDEGEYLEFTDSLTIDFYNIHGYKESTLSAGYGKYWEDKELGYARDNVVGRKLSNGDSLNTEELYWDKKKQIIYSSVFTTITNEEGVFYGEEGFESDQDMENYKLIGSSGTVNVKDEDF